MSDAKGGMVCRTGGRWPEAVSGMKTPVWRDSRMARLLIKIGSV